MTLNGRERKLSAQTVGSAKIRRKLGRAAFELEFDISKAIATKDGFLIKLLDRKCKQLAVVKSELKKTSRLYETF